MAPGRLGILILTLPAALCAQTSTLRGEVTDETGAVIPAAIVAIKGHSGAKTVTADGSGVYIFSAVQPGKYTVQASAPDLALPKPIEDRCARERRP